MQIDLKDINIKKLTLEDIEKVSSTFSTQFDEFWSISTLKSDFEENSSTYIAAKIDNNVIGLAGVKIILEQADIMNIAVRKDFRRLNIGSMLLENLILISKNAGCKKIMLEVNEKNLPAIHLYKKYGFKQISIRKKYYNNQENAIIMELSLL